MTDSQRPSSQTTRWRGPNAAGWIVILACTWSSYAEWTLWPIVVLIALCIPSAMLMAWEALKL